MRPGKYNKSKASTATASSTVAAAAAAVHAGGEDGGRGGNEINGTYEFCFLLSVETEPAVREECRGRRN